MESWSFPPAYDQGFMPELDSRYWFPVRETMDPVEREAAIVERIGQVMLAGAVRHIARADVAFGHLLTTITHEFRGLGVLLPEALHLAHLEDPARGDDRLGDLPEREDLSGEKLKFNLFFSV